MLVFRWKPIVVLLLLLQCFSGIANAQSYVQSKTNAVGTGGNNTATFTSAPTSGNTIVVGLVCYGPSDCSISSITDNFSNTYSQVGPTATYGGPTQNITHVALYCSPGVATGSNFTVTATLSNGSGGDSNLYIAEYSGLTCNVDGSASGSLTSGTATTSLSTSSATTANANDLLVAVAGSSTGNTATAGTGYTLRQNGNSGTAEYGGFEDRTVTTAGSYSAAMTLANTTSYWGMSIAALTAGSGTAPSITSLSPTSGSVGTSVIVTGTHFGATQGTSTLKFNGTTATVTSWSSTSIVATVPTGATTGNVVVTVSSVSSNGVAFTVQSGAISYVQSQTNAIGTGGNDSATFSTTPVSGDTVVAGIVCYGPTDCPINSITDNFSNTYSQVGPTKMYGGPTQNITRVALYCSSGISSGNNFTVTASLGNGTLGDSNLYIAEYSGLSCNVDQSAGGSLTNGTGTTSLSTSSVTTTNGNNLIVAVAGATTGNAATAGSGFTLRKNGNSGAAEYGGYEDRIVTTTGSYSASMTLAANTSSWAMSMAALKAGSGSAPSITGLSPTSGAVGASVTISGTHFGSTQGSSAVKFNGTTATVTSWSATAIVATVPSGATTGNVTVVVGGVSSNGVSFTVQAGSGGIAYVQSKTGAVASSGNNAVTFTTQPTSGDTIVVGLVCYGPNDCTLSSLTDNFGNSYAQIGPGALYGGPTRNITRVSMYCASAISTGSSFTVTAALSNAGGGDSNLYIAEYSGLTCNVDQSASGSLTDGTATTLIQTSASPTTTNATDQLVVVAGSSTGGAVTAGSGYTMRQTGNTGGAENGGFEDKTVTATGVYSGNMTLTSGSSYWAAVLVALKAGGTGTAPNLASLAPASGAVGASVTLTGTNFGATQGTSTVNFNGSAATVTSWSATTIVATVPTGATTGNVTVTVGGIISNGRSFTVLPAPTISGLSPTSGAIGSSVTISGTNFGISQGGGGVKFNGIVATPTSWGSTSIVVPVPTLATTGSVVVFASGVNSNGTTFTVLPTPNISALNPVSGVVGTSVSITGSNFGAAQGTSTVKFNGTTATASSWAAGSIATSVPAGATTGNVIVTVGGVASNAVLYTILPTPNITGLSVNSGAVGAPVTISGTNFGATQGTSSISFNGTAATATSWTSTSIVTSVPGTATTGPLVITVSGVPSNGVVFSVLPSPTITAISPTAGAVGASIAVTGTNFGATQGTSTVSFNGSAASVTNWSATSITASVPSGASTGSVVIHVGGVDSSGATFTVLGTPSITSLSLTSGAIGTPITITGSNFGATQGASIVSFNGTQATPTAWSSTSITVPVPAGATTGNVIVHASGVDSNGSAFTVTAAPSVAGLSPASAAAGALVTISGSGFGATQGTSTVKFNGTSAAVTSWSATSIVVTVPVGATTGNVVVTVGGVGSSSGAGSSFTVTASPSITTLSPNSGAVGTPVTISGANFGTTQGTSTVSFNGMSATPTSWSPTSIAVTVPAGATTGNVVVHASGVDSNGSAFTVVSAPNISNISPSSAAVGATITIAGVNFGATQGTSTVKFNGTVATITSWSATSIVAQVPVAATSGSVTVTVGGVASNSANFTLVASPTIATLSPTSGAIGTVVTITGTNFGGTQNNGTVSFNGTPATITSWSATNITTSVPSGASTGNVVVSANGVNSNGVSFTVTSAPVITTVSPTSGAIGAVVTISGANFGAAQGASTIKFNGTSATPTNWTATLITVPVPISATTGNVVVTVSGTASNGVNFSVLGTPTLTSMSVTSGAVGAVVTLTGTNFGSVQGNGSVSFNGTSASVTSWSATTIVTQVPPGGTTGNVVVSTSGVSSNGLSFTVVAAPSISGLSPTSGGVGSTVNITGSNFGATQGSSTVAFNGTAATATSWSTTNIVVSVPSGASSGTVVVHVAGVDSNGSPFTVTGTPTITNVSPLSGSVGAVVTITGNNFGTTQGTSTLKFNGSTATVTNWSATSISTTVPSGATTGNIVVNVGGVNSNGSAFTVLTAPTIASLTPNSGAVGAIVDVTGTNFGASQGASTVKFNGTLATVTGWSPTDIFATVPTGAATGNVVVTVGGVASSGVSFTVLPAPILTALSPSTGGFGTTVTITGSNFGATQGDGSVVFAGGAEATISSWSATSIVAIVPRGSITGNVIVEAAGIGSNGLNFTLLPTAPSIDFIGPAGGAPGSVVTILGSNFGATQGTSTVKFNGTSAAVSSWDDDSVTVVVPVGATTGSVVVNVGGVNSNGKLFTVTGQNTSTGNMTTVRSMATATVLTNGLVLIAGGESMGSGAGSATGYTASAELYNPATGTFTATGSMTFERASHSATLLSNGLVLITGGSNLFASVLAPAELYDPSTGTFSRTGSLNTARFGATATLLGTGQVLIVGGFDENNNVLTSAELYDPSTGAFTATGSLNTGRGSHCATLLNTGMTLIAGGDGSAGAGGGFVPLTSAELYDPSTGSFISTGTMKTVRGGFPIATLLNSGKVLITGGYDELNFDIQPTTDLYDPASGTFASTGNMVEARINHTATLLNNGTVLIAGGFNSSVGSEFTNEIYDPQTGVFSLTTGLNVAREKQVAIRLANGNILIAGGYGENGDVSSAELYQPSSLVPAGLVSITLSPTAPSLSTNSNQHFTALGTFSDSSIQTLASAYWATSTSTVATVTNDATDFASVFVQATGSATVSACTGTICGTTSLTGTTGTLRTPSISTVSPTAGAIGASVTISGANFGSTPGSSSITFNGVTATPNLWLPGSVVTSVPPTATTGNIVAHIKGTDSNQVAFTVLPTPSISSLSPTSGSTGTSVTITGTGFGATQGTSTVTFNGALGTPTSWSSTSVSVPVPASATSGSVVIHAGGVDSNGVNFTDLTGGLQSISLLINYPALETGQTEQLVALGSYSDGSQQDLTKVVTWSSSISTVATTSSTGFITGVAAGQTTIQATLTGVSGSATVTITGQNPSSGNLNTSRNGHTATVLNNGLVLIVGGFDTNDISLRTAELYNPSTGAFTTTGSLNTGRSLHTATLLSDGTVLIAGGVDSHDGTPSATAEVYDPSIGTFTLTTGQMGNPRFHHQATLLSNGKVLIGGGDPAPFSKHSDVPRLVEIYDPTTRLFYGTGPMNVPRRSYSATALPSGLVLIAGGEDDVSFAATSELFDPTTETFAVTGDLSIGRANPAAILLDNGKVLIAAGDTSSTSALPTTAELYDPTTGLFSATGSLNVARREGATATLLNNGGVLIAGGEASELIGSLAPPLSSAALDSTELYDPVTGTFSFTTGLDVPRMQHTASLLGNGKVIIIGGSNGDGTYASSELYQPNTLTPSGLISIAINPISVSIPQGTSQGFAAKGTFVDGSKQDLPSVSWTSSNQSAVSVTNDATNRGRGYAITTGTATLSACAGSVCGTTSVTETASQLLITGVTPPAAAIGATVTIAGTNFGATQGSSTITFAGVAGSVTSWSNSRIITTVPIGALTGSVFATVSGSSSNGMNFTVLPAPSITSLSPSSGEGGTSITITGTNFGTTQGTDSGQVKFTGAIGTATTWTSTSIVVPVPQGTKTGNLVVHANGVDSNGLNFTALLPTITSLSPPAATAGSTVTVNGLNFTNNSFPPNSLSLGSEVLDFGNTSIWNDTSIVFRVPDDAVSGNVSVFVNAIGANSNGVLFSVVPTLSSLSPSTGTTGQVSITGTGFGPNPTAAQGHVTFNGLTATIQSWSPRLILASVPVGATTGPVIVTVNGILSNGLTYLVGPGISGLTPNSGAVGSAVTISGAGFGASRGSSTVLFNGVPATPTSWSDTSIQAPVPVGATTGIITVTVNGLTTNGVSFLVSPGIASVTPPLGTVGTSVTIVGTNFGASEGSSTVKFAGTTATAISWGPTKIVTPVPSGATTGSIVVTVGGQASNGITFTVGTGTFAGTITKVSDGSPVNGATVQALQSNVIKGTATTASNGTYNLTGLSAGTYDIRVSASGLGASILAGNTISGTATVTVNAALSSAGTISGVITQSNGVTPISGATVSALQGAIVAASSTTNSSGSYSISGLSSGSYSLQVSATGFVQQTQSVSVTGGGTTTSNFQLSGQSTITYTYDKLGRLVGVVDSINGSATYRYDAVGNLQAIGRNAAGQVSITGFSPISGTVGSQITISGASFSPTADQNTVKIGGVPASVVSATSVQLTITVPAGASTGSISVTTSAGTATSSGTFTVASFVLTPTTLTISSAGQTVTQGLTGAAGEHLTVYISNNTLGPAIAQLLDAAGNVITSAYGSTSTFTLPSVTLSTNGTYSVSVQAQTSSTGTITVSATTP